LKNMADSQAQLDAALAALEASNTTLTATEAALVTEVGTLSTAANQLDTDVTALIAKINAGGGGGLDLTAEVTAVQKAQAAVDAANASAAAQVTGLTTDTTGLAAADTAAQVVINQQAAAPTLTSISPNTGPAAGGTPVTLTGTGFDGPNFGVDFGNEAATGLVVQSDTAATCNSPAGLAGVVNVTALSSAGTSAPQPYTYV
jgi:hypothetical protein